MEYYCYIGATTTNALDVGETIAHGGSAAVVRWHDDGTVDDDFPTVQLETVEDTGQFNVTLPRSYGPNAIQAAVAAEATRQCRELGYTPLTVHVGGYPSLVQHRTA